MFRDILIPLLVFIVVMLGVALFLNIRKAGRKKRDDAENVVDLNDRFNRARHMNDDGE